MPQFKYITVDILDEVLPYIQKQLNKTKKVKLSDKEIDYLKHEILNRCPSCFLKLLNLNKSFEAFRIIVEYNGDIGKAFYPQLIIEKKRAVGYYLINKFLAEDLVPKISKKEVAEDKFFERLLTGICKLLGVSVFGRIEAAEHMVNRMKRYKKVVEIRKGELSVEHGKYNGNPYSSGSHVTWFPYVEINEWDIFSEVVKNYY